MIENHFRSIVKILLFTVSLLLALYILIARPVFVTKEHDLVSSFVKSDDLKSYVRFLSESALPRDSDSPDNLNSVAEYISSQFKLHTSSVVYQTYSADGKEYKNIISAFGPDTKDVIIVGAHYDSYSKYPAADDNASGVAGLIELGKLLQKIKLKHRVLLVAYTLEEPPYYATDKMGSFVHASSLSEKNIKLMISLEMIGYFSNDPDSQSFPISLLKLFYPTRGNFITVVDSLIANDGAPLKASINKYTDLPAYSINAPRSIPGIDYSDHRSYWHFGYPAVMVTDTSFYRNHSYHQQQDTYDKLNYENMAKVVYGVFKYVQQLDSNN